jgi:hypothetical protein
LVWDFWFHRRENFAFTTVCYVQTKIAIMAVQLGFDVDEAYP